MKSGKKLLSLTLILVMVLCLLPAFSLETKADKIQLTVAGSTADSKIYDGTTDAQAHVGTVSGIVDGDIVVVEIASATFADKNAGNGKYVTISYKLSGADSDKYIAPANDVTVADIEKKPITVVAEDKFSNYNANLVPLTYISEALCGDDTFSGELTTNASKDLVGDHTIMQGTLTAGDNYSIKFTEGKYSVFYNKEIRKVSFNEKNIVKTYGEENFTLEWTGNEKLMATYTYSSDNTYVAQVDADTGEVTIKGAGSAVITVSLDETQRSCAESAACILTVEKVKVSVPTAKTGLVYEGFEMIGVEAVGTLYTLSGNTGTDSGIYTATAVLNDKNNYVWDVSPASSSNRSISWSIGRRNIIFTSGTSQKEYDGKSLTNFSVDVGGNGFASSDDANCEFTGTLTKVGSINNEFTVKLDAGVKSGNYNITRNFGTLTITPVSTPIVITANSKTKTYDGKALTDDGYTYTDGVLKDGDVLTAVVEGSITEAGNVENKVTSYKVMNGEEDRTACYTIQTVDGKLQVIAVPNTGDEIFNWIYLMLAAGALVAIGGFAFARSRRARK